MKQFLSYKMIAVLTGTLWLLACGASTPSHQARAAQPDRPPGTPCLEKSLPFVPDQVLVCFKQPPDQAGLEALTLQFKLELIERFATPGLFLMRISDGTPVQTMIQRLKAHHAIRYAEPNYIVSTPDAMDQ